MKEPIKFEVHYHGTPVLVGKRYDPKDLHAHLIFSDKEFVDVRSIDFMTDKDIITHTGQNYFRATYNWNDKTFIDYFMVYGYTNKRYIDKEFKIFFIHDDGVEEDMTEYYELLFYENNMEKVFITTNKLDKTLTEGKYRMILPRGTGMHLKYASEWIIEKDSNVKVKLIKVYNEEDIQNEQKEEGNN